jgi:hypothetical protein
MQGYLLRFKYNTCESFIFLVAVPWRSAQFWLVKEDGAGAGASGTGGDSHMRVQM